VPDTVRMEEAWKKLRLTVQISTKLNRSHLVHGAISYILPCLGRIEIDEQQGVAQSVSVEDSTGCMHGSRGRATPASKHLLSEPAIIAGIAKATLRPNPLVSWDDWVADYASVRGAIEVTYPEIFRDFNARMWIPGGFRRPVPASERIWKTPTGRATFMLPAQLDEDPDIHSSSASSPDIAGSTLRLFTLRSDGQFNTTIYSNDDRFRGVYGTRMVIFMCPEDITKLGLNDGDLVTATTPAKDGMSRTVSGLRVTSYDIPRGCVAGYYPECNPLIPMSHHAKQSMVPAAKAIEVLLSRETAQLPSALA
jgi:anaerobic selenocysteine-containing dehydrogenase